MINRKLLVILFFVIWCVFAAVAQVPLQASAVGVSDPEGGIGVRLLPEPGDAGRDPRAQLYIVEHIPPGSVLSRRIEVINSTGEPVTVSLYAAGATIEDGHFVGADDRSANDLSTWSSVLPATVDLPGGGGSAIVTVMITVPPDAAPGERLAAVWAEVRSGTTSGILQINRVGIRLYVSVGPGAAPASDFTIVSLTAQRSLDGFPTVVATVRNTGGRALDIEGSLELLNGPGGLRAGPFPVTLGTTISGGDTEQVSIALDQRIPNGPWDAELTLHSGLLERSAKARITFPESGSELPVPATEITGGAGWPFAVVAGFILLVALLILWLHQRRTRI
jgi:hypothetical protein